MTLELRLASSNFENTSSKAKLITSGARSAERVYFYIWEKSQYERPAVVTLFGCLFLWNGKTNSRTVILTLARAGGVDATPHEFF